MTRLTEDQVRSAADLLVALREGRLELAGLPAELTPDHTTDMQRIIIAMSERIDRPIGGWKTYTVYKPMNPPFHAPIYDVFPSGAEIPAGISRSRLVEPEIMFRLDRDLPARDRNYGVDEVRDAVTGVVGFEVRRWSNTRSRLSAMIPTGKRWSDATCVPCPITSRCHASRRWVSGTAKRRHAGAASRRYTSRPRIRSTPPRSAPSTRTSARDRRSAPVTSTSSRSPTRSIR